MLKILHLEDDSSDALLVRRALQASTLDIDLTWVTSRDEFLAALAGAPWDVVLADQ
jgi:CheY-like chemotaxis protein